MTATDTPPLQTAWQAALQILTRRSHSRNELAAKLARRGIDKPTVDAVLTRCIGLGYLDDADWAQVQARRLSAKGYGVHYIRHLLYGKGIEQAMVEQVLAAAHSGWENEAAAKALVKKQPALAREKDPVKRQAKAYRFLTSRGFSAQAIAEVMDGKIT